MDSIYITDWKLAVDSPKKVRSVVYCRNDEILGTKDIVIPSGELGTTFAEKAIVREELREAVMDLFGEFCKVE